MKSKEELKKDREEDLKYIYNANCSNKSQEEVVGLLRDATPKAFLQPWTRGFVPKHY